ncbi:hypothetical protein M422DRAFT_57816 [Sphaerobolus stellatus SS14]|nr:hypothetical protein M422DRAFT_57816 [Sphaerobolus stellatus SS14]
MSGYSQAVPTSGHRHTSSTSSQGSRSSRRDNYGNSPAVESAVTRLLVAIKQLLEALTQWSQGRMSETDVSDVYVRLGNDFNAAVAAFSQYNIDMSELLSVPDDLRAILETCLAEDASPAVLDIYLPGVRSVITNLLQGLRAKQTIYRQRPRPSSTNSQGESLRRDSRNSRSSHDRTRSSRGERERHSNSSTRRREAVSENDAHAVGPAEDGWVGGFAVPSVIPPNDHSATSPQSSRRSGASGYGYVPQEQLPPPMETEEAQLHPSITNPPPPPPPLPTIVQQAPPSLVRYSLIDPPVPPTPPAETETETQPTFVVESATPNSTDDTFPNGNSNNGTGEAREPERVSSPPPPEMEKDPETASSLAALKKSDALERRASKRFSTYTFSKMTGSRDKPSLDKLIGGDDRRRNRRSAVFGAALTPKDLASLVEEPENPQGSGAEEITRERSTSRRKRVDPDAPPIPPIPEAYTPSRTPEPSTDKQSLSEDVIIEARGTATNKQPSTPSTPSLQSVSVFLKLGLQVKKVTLDRDSLSIPSLRLQFTEKFSYNPGMENFPAIYINDPDSHIQYELEDMDEIKDKSLLSLNIEPLDQIKQHIDLQITNLTQDIKDLKTAVTSSRRQSIPPQQAILTPMQTPMARPSENQFANVAKRVADRLHRAHNIEPSQRMVASDETGRGSMSYQPPLIQQMTGGSDVNTSRIMTDLKTQFDEVRNLRRDLGIMRQLYTDFVNQTKESLGSMRTQTASVRQLAATKVGGARAYIDSGKANLDTRSQNVLTKVEELQDTIETLKHDVLKRHVSPRPNLMKTLKADIDTAAEELQSLTQHIQTVKPMWKKTWEEELQNIVEEQQFLQYQEEFMTDLQEDHKALSEVYGHIEKVISLRGTAGSGRSRAAFRPPPVEDNQDALTTVMLEIRNAAVDPERRLKAIEANQKTREKELASRSDEFEAELNGFVQGKKLKMTGGAEEVERMRQKRNEMALKQMFNQGSSSLQPQLTGASLQSQPTGDSSGPF